MTDYALVLSRRHADKQWAINGNDYDSLVMFDGNDKPSKKSLDDAWLAVKTEVETENEIRAAAAASARAKLAALGLTEAEVKTLVG
jgi:hypothetical protein